MAKQLAGELFQVGDFAEHRAKDNNRVAGEVVRLDGEDVVIFDLIAAPGKRNVFQLPAKGCRRIDGRTLLKAGSG